MGLGEFDVSALNAALHAAWMTFTQSPTFKVAGAIVTFSIAALGIVTTKLEMIQKFLETVQKIRDLLKPDAVPAGPIDTQDARARLLRVVLSEYARRRQDSLHNLVMVDMGFQTQGEAIGRPEPLLLAPEPETVDRTLTIAGHADVMTIPIQQSLLDVYNQVEISGKLLILGNPGSGKTTELLKFATALTTKAILNPLEPIPVLLELSTWTEGTMETWIMARLKRLYNVDGMTAQAWLRDEQLVLLLDGLNELGLTRQERAIVEINHFLAETGYPHCVVCCRSEEYKAGQERLSQLNGAIYLKPLSDGQIQRYLEDVGRSPFWGNIENQPALLTLARSPLLLTIMVTVYQDRQIRTSEELLDLYIDYAFTRNGRPGGDRIATRPQAMHYLHCLARQLKLQSRTELLIERIQPKSLPSDGDRLLYRLLCGGVISVFSGGVGWVVFGQVAAKFQIFMTIVGLAFGFFYGVYSREKMSDELQKIPLLHLPSLQPILNLLDNEEIEPVRLGWSWDRAKTGLIAGLTLGFVLGFIVFLYDWLVGGFWLGLRWGLALWISYGCFLGIVSGLQAGVRGSTEPNQGMWESLKNAIAVTLLATPMAMLVAGVGLLIPLGSVNWRLAFWIGIAGGLLSGLFSGGIPCIQHLVLRILLWRRGMIPWNYAQFLEYAHDLRLLQRVGGRYRFIHELLREHFELIKS